MELDGKNILVVGAGRGIGKATALALAREGANVAVASLHGELADQAAEEVRKLSRK